MRARLSVVIFLGLFATPAASLQNLSPLPATSLDDEVAAASAGDIIDRAIERAKLQDEAGAELHFQSLVATTVDSLNGDGEVTKTETTLHKRYPVEGVLYEELIERDGHPLTEKEIRDEQENREEFAREVREKADRGKEIETNDERQVRFDRDLIDRYQATVVGVEDVRGEPCWVLAFEPRPGKLPEETRMDKALNRSSGRLYIAQSDHGTMRIEFQMREPIRYLWGIIATLRNATGRLEFERVEPDTWLPQSFDLAIDLRILFRTRHQRVSREWVWRQRLDAADAS